MIATAVAVPAALLVGFLLRQGEQPDEEPTGSPAPSTSAAALSVAPPPATGDAAELCPQLTDSLPETIAGLPSRPLDPANPNVRAWGESAIVLRCGVDRPAALTAASPLITVNGVDWLYENQKDTADLGLLGKHTVWTTTDRQVYVEVVVPSDVGSSTALSQLAAAVADALPRTPPPS